MTSPTRWQVWGLLSSSVAKNTTTKCGFIVILSCKRWQWASTHCCLLMFCPLLANDDDEPRVHCCQFYFFNTYRKRRWTHACHHLFLFCLCAFREDDDKPMLVVIFFYFIFMHPKKMTMSKLLSYFFVFFLCT